MYLPIHSLLYITSIILTSLALAQDDPPAIIPPGSQTQMYPPYTYIPSVFATCKPNPHGLPFLHPNTTINPTSPLPHNPPPNPPPSLPPLVPSNPQSYWYSQITHNGISPFIANGTSWKVYRNVHDYGALGDGTHDDAPAI
jgi:glucan 1,3-beta-glucosidase